VNVKWGGDKREMLKMRDKGIWKILADNYPLMTWFENYFIGGPR
jgi:hypothetical protein